MLPPISMSWCVRAVLAGLLMAAAMPLSACDRLYYKAMRKVGFEKRDILVKRVKEARESQARGQTEFKTALEHWIDLLLDLLHAHDQRLGTAARIA